MSLINKLFRKLRTPLSIEYANEFLRSKSIVTNVEDESSLTFKLYDINWDLFCEKNRLGIRKTFNISNDTDMDCMLQAANKLNDERWIVKAFVHVYPPINNESEPNEESTTTTITFSFESFCYSQVDFKDLYEFAMYAMTDAIDFHRKNYHEFVEKKKAQNTTMPIGFQTNNTNKSNIETLQGSHNRKRIGFV